MEKDGDKNDKPKKAIHMYDNSFGHKRHFSYER